MSEGYSSSGYHIELLKGENWVPWKRRMMAVLRDLSLGKYIETTATSPMPGDPNNPTKDETEAMDKWREGDADATPNGLAMNLPILHDISCISYKDYKRSK